MAPKAFEDCVRRGGRVRTVTGPSGAHGLKAGQYVRYCYIDGKAYRGHVKHLKKRNGSKRNKNR